MNKLYGRGITQEEYVELSDMMRDKGVSHRAFELLAELATSAKVHKDEADAVRHSVVCSLEGTFDYDGLPVSNVNYLQCIRRCVAGVKDIKTYSDPDVYRSIFGVSL